MSFSVNPSMAPRARPCVLLAAAVLLAAVHSGSLEWTCSCFAEDLGENRAPAPLNFNGFLSCSLEKKTAMNSEWKNHDGALKPTVGSIESHELLFSHPSKKSSHVYVLYFWEAIHKQLPCLNSHHNPFPSSMVKQTLSQNHFTTFQNIQDLIPKTSQYDAVCTMIWWYL